LIEKTGSILTYFLLLIACFLIIFIIFCVVSEQGYCMRGDLCQFDHGTDPVVVDNMPGLAYTPQGIAPAATHRGAASTTFVPIRPAQGGVLTEQPAIPIATSAGEDST